MSRWPRASPSLLRASAGARCRRDTRSRSRSLPAPPAGGARPGARSSPAARMCPRRGARSERVAGGASVIPAGSELQFGPEPALPRKGDGQLGGREILDRQTERLEQGQLAFGGPAGVRAGEQLAELGADVARADTAFLD